MRGEEIPSDSHHIHRSKSGQGKSAGKIRKLFEIPLQGFSLIPDIWNMLSYLQFYHIPFLVPKTPAPPNNNEGPILFPELVDFSAPHLVFHLFFSSQVHGFLPVFFTSTWFFTCFFSTSTWFFT